MPSPNLIPLADRGPLRVLFAINNLQVGGAEMLTYELLRRLDREHFAPELACMREAGLLGEKLATEIPVHTHLLAHKLDLRILWKLTGLLRRGKFDAIVTVGAGDRMFYGRIAARLAGTPVVVSALHSTGWPDIIHRPNRWLTPWTDAFVGCAAPHARYLTDVEQFPPAKVHWIPNGVDTQKFCPRNVPAELRASLQLPPDAPLVGIVAQLRPEKNHELFLHVARAVVQQVPETHFLLIGSGPKLAELQSLAAKLGIASQVRFLGARNDVPQLLPLLDIFVLCSKIEANPVSILEAQACGVPVVATRVGSIPETVLHEQTGLLATPESGKELTQGIVRLLMEPALRASYGAAARANVVANWSLERMVCGYEELLSRLYGEKCGGGAEVRGKRVGVRGEEKVSSTPRGAPGELESRGECAPLTP
ncbi:MAG: glycosyltransferase [Pirellulales bacterium]|nr:glycosyltransferase [Pirellulales bacterium]